MDKSVPDLTSKPLFRRKEAAKFVEDNFGVPCAPGTLAKLAVVGGGPAFQKAGPTPLYHPDDLKSWAQNRLSKRVFSTAELTEAAA